MLPPTFLVELINNTASRPDVGVALGLESMLHAANVEGVTALIAHNLACRNHNYPVSADFVEEFIRAGRQAVAVEMLLGEERRKVLASLQPYKPLLLKGVAMAYLYYSSPHLRPMADMDVLIGVDDAIPVREALISSGLQAYNSIAGDLVMNQFTLGKQVQHNVSLNVDVHTRLFNRPALAGILPYEEILGQAISIPDLGKDAFAPCPAHLLIHACLHLLAHHRNSRRLIWLYDIKLLVDQFTEQDIAQFFEFAEKHGLAQIMHQPLMQCMDRFPGNYLEIPVELEKMAQIQQITRHPATELLLAESGNATLWQDWKHLGGIPSRIRWLRQHLLPGSEYMMKHYDLHYKWQLPGYYFWRILRGSVRLFLTKG